MDSFNLSEDINVLCLTAESFPDGIESAQIHLQAMLDHKDKRRFFGISWPENGKITYRAAAEILDKNEPQRLGLETFTIKKGYFNCFYFKDYRDNIDAIRQSFDILLKQQEVDPNGYCLEWYIGEHDVKCMVPVDDHLHFTGLNKE